MNSKILRRVKRHKKLRQKITGTKNCPRLSVFKSNKYIYAQLINDLTGEVLLSVTEKELTKRGKKSDNALELGKILAKKALPLKIKKVVFDRGGYKYHGRVKNLAIGAREGGLKF